MAHPPEALLGIARALRWRQDFQYLTAAKLPLGAGREAHEVLLLAMPRRTSSISALPDVSGCSVSAVLLT